MIKHIVLFKFKADANERDRQQAIADLRALPGKIDVIREYEVGEDVLRSARSWDMVIVSAFDNLETLDIYQRHDAHTEVASRLATMKEAIAAVDYEY
jgi:hypothetical protein